jgi:hypothetical protein
MDGREKTSDRLSEKQAKEHGPTILAWQSQTWWGPALDLISTWTVRPRCMKLRSAEISMCRLYEEKALSTPSVYWINQKPERDQWNRVPGTFKKNPHKKSSPDGRMKLMIWTSQADNLSFPLLRGAVLRENEYIFGHTADRCEQKEICCDFEHSVYLLVSELDEDWVEKWGNHAGLGYLGNADKILNLDRLRTIWEEKQSAILHRMDVFESPNRIFPFSRTPSITSFSTTVLICVGAWMWVLILTLKLISILIFLTIYFSHERTV